MTSGKKKVAKRTWSFSKFSASVKSTAKRLGFKCNAAKIKPAYEANWSVRHTVHTIAA